MSICIIGSLEMTAASRLLVKHKYLLHAGLKIFNTSSRVDPVKTESTFCLTLTPNCQNRRASQLH